MKMLSVELIKNKRLLLAKIDRIKIDFTADCQTIIGTNGSGKSTLIREASPLPPNSTDYDKGGMKRVVFEHKGEEYVATSKYEKSWTHSLIRRSDDEELNPGLTKRVQEQLIKDLTGLNYELFDVLVGDTLFTQMTPAKRREWILTFSGSDLEYAMTVFKKLTRQFMDAQALSKHYAKRLATEIESVMSENELGELKKRSGELTKKIDLLINERGNKPTWSSDEYHGRVDNSLNKIHGLEQRIDITSVNVPRKLSGYINSISDISGIRNSLKSDIVRFDHDLTKAYSERSKIEKHLEELQSSGVKGIGELEDKIKTLTEKLNAEKTLINHYLEKTHPQQAHGALSAIMMDLVSLLNRLTDDVTEEQKTQTRNKLSLTQNQLNKSRQALQQIEHKLYHINNIQPVDCPKCDHHWTPGVDDEDVEKLELDFERTSDYIATMESSCKDLEETMSKINEHENNRAALNAMANHTRVLTPLWNKVFDHLHSGEPLVQLTAYVHEYHEDLERSIGIDQINEEIVFCNHILENARSLSSDGYLDKEKLTSLESDIEYYIGQRNDAQQLLNEVNAFDKIMFEHIDAVTDHEHEIKDLENHLLDYLLAVRYECLSEDIGNLQTDVAEIQGKVGSASTARALIEELRKNKEIADADVLIYKSLVDGLSPTDGLIAERIRLFIDGFIEQMNAVIEEVWTYPMKIISCGVDEAIDCKFPLEAEGENSDGVIKVISPDVSKSSSAQTDIINFAFRLDAMMCLGLESFPLYLDEAGVRMDEKHRDRFNGLIERILEHKRVSQVFMISHYAVMHGVFTNAEIAVLDDKNIIHMPEEYNQHVDIEYSN